MAEEISGYKAGGTGRPVPRAKTERSTQAPCAQKYSINCRKAFLKFEIGDEDPRKSAKKRHLFQPAKRLAVCGWSPRYA